MQEPEYIFTKGVGWHPRPYVEYKIVTHKNGRVFRIEKRKPKVGETYVHGFIDWDFEHIEGHIAQFDWYTGINKARDWDIEEKGNYFTILDA